MPRYRAALASSLLLTLLPGCKTDVRSESSGEVTVPDAPPGTSNPTPTPTPTPPPPGPSPAPGGPTGANPIASNFNVSTTLQAAWGTGAIPASAKPDVVGAYRFICGAGQLSYDDPIVYPGQPGKSHLHQFYGNTAANANSTFASLRASGDSTCNNMGNGTAANRSAYWMPAMLDGKGHVVMPDYVQVYYKRGPDNAGECSQNICVGIPNGVKFVQGFDMASGSRGPQPGDFVCGSAIMPNLANARANCRAGQKLEMRIQSLKCWNGALDSADHRSHFSPMVSDASTGWVKKCPKSHPYLVPQFTISSFYTIGSGDDVGLWSLSSDMMFPNLPKGSTIHFDYFEAWDVLVKDMWVNNCLGKLLNCSGGDLGNGKQLKGAAQPKYGWSVPTRLVPVASRAAP
jgi:hypothetical protein